MCVVRIMMWSTDAFCSSRKEGGWVPRVTAARERRRRTRKTSVLTAQHGAVMVGSLVTSRHGVTVATHAKSRDDGHGPDGPESPLGGRGQWSTCSLTPSHLIGSALHGCRMGRSRKLSPCDAISF